MKKIINGKVYDTSSAKEIGHYENGLPTDFDYIEEVLYRKRTGEFFLHGFGGARTKYATSIGGNSWASGEKILPVSYEEARQWAEEHLDAETYEAAFGAVIEDDSKTTINLSLPVSLVEQLKRDSSKAGMGLSAYVEQLLSK